MNRFLGFLSVGQLAHPGYSSRVDIPTLFAILLANKERKHMLRIGTSGYSFRDWVGPVYPANTKPGDMLDYYAQRLGFNAVELNFTYYRQPSLRTTTSISSRVPSGFEFTVKAHRSMTHDFHRTNGEIAVNEAAFDTFYNGILPLIENKQLGCVLFQFPFSFRPTRETRQYLARCTEALREMPIVVEFRNSAWAKQSVFSFLQQHKIGYCCVDEPHLPGLMPFVPRLTSTIGYFRFHGRNNNWFSGSSTERYNYLYSDAELSSFVPALKQASGTAEKTYVFFNNCHAGKAVFNGQTMLQLLAR